MIQARLAASRAHCLIEQMRSAFDDAEVQGWEGLEGTYGLPDPDDEHVVAVAVVAGAAAIVTHNTKDFPQNDLPDEIEVISPAEFAANTASLDPVRALDAVAAIVERSGRKAPTIIVDDVLDTLVKRYGMAHVVELIRQVC